MENDQKRNDHLEQNQQKEQLLQQYTLGSEAGENALNTQPLREWIKTVSLPAPSKDEIKESYLNGYIFGLKKFLKQHHISYSGFWETPDNLIQSYSLTAYIRGLQKEAPHISRMPQSVTNHNKFQTSNGDKTIDWQQRTRDQDGQQASSWRLGFITAIARDYDVSLKSIEIPTDDASHSAFMAGLRGEPRALFDESNQHFLQANLPKYYPTREERAYELLDTGLYLVGLKIWLSSHGITEVQSTQLRHPDALQAFQAALAGKPPNFSLSPNTNGTTEKTNQQDSSLNRENQTEFQQRRGYFLGVAVRQARNPNDTTELTQK